MQYFGSFPQKAFSRAALNITRKIRNSSLHGITNWIMKLTTVKKRVSWKHWPPVHGPPLRTGSADYPTDRSMDYPFGPPLWNTSQNRLKIIDGDFTYGLSNRLQGEISNATLCKWNRLGFRLGSKLYHYTHCNFLCCGYKAYIKDRELKPPGSLDVCAPSPPPFCSANWVCELVPDFTICSADLKMKQANELKTHPPYLFKIVKRLWTWGNGAI